MNKKGFIGLVIIIIVIFIAGFFWFMNHYHQKEEVTIIEHNQTEDIFSLCSKDSDCVPEHVCHPKDCVAKTDITPITKKFCTQECEPESLDCGQGSCSCIKGKCGAVFT